MSVYVDDMCDTHLGAVGRMKMSHMIADTTEELLVMADRIGVSRKWIQYPGTDREHFDIAKSKRAAAIAAGAISMSMRELALTRKAISAARRQTGVNDVSDPNRESLRSHRHQHHAGPCVAHLRALRDEN